MHRSLKDYAGRLALLAALVAAVTLGPPLARQFAAEAQPVPSVVGPYNVDLGALVTNTAQVASAGIQSASQQNLDQNGAVCVFSATVNSGSPSTTFSIQGYDAATATWFTYVTSGAITAINTTVPIFMYPGAQTASLPTGAVAVGLPLPRVWRVSESVGGSNGPAVTAKIGCTILK